MAKDKKAGKKSKTKAADAIKSVAMSPMVQEVVAAALVATAAALKDTKKARAMAMDAGDQLQNLADDSKQKGKALWALALEVARRAGDIVQEKPKAKAKKAKAKVKAVPRAKAAPKASAKAASKVAGKAAPKARAKAAAPARRKPAAGKA